MFESALKKSAPEGVGGWLLLFVIGQSIVCLSSLVTAPSVIAQFQGASWQLGERIWLLRPLLIIESVIHLTQIVFPPIGLVLILRRSPITRDFWRAYLFALVLYGVLELVATPELKKQVISVVGESAFKADSDQMSQASLLNARLVLFGLIWGLYWTRSERVRNTFAERPATEGIPTAVGP